MKEVSKEVLNYFNQKKTQNLDQSLQDAVTAALRGKSITLDTCAGKEAAYEIHNLSFHCRKLEKNLLITEEKK